MKGTGTLVLHAVALVALLAASTAAAAPSSPKKEAGTAARRLSDISIEGVIEGPRVFFITARSRPRYRDGLHRRYLPSALEAARDASRPPSLSLRHARESERGGPRP
jgi:hypothetical protein